MFGMDPKENVHWEAVYTGRITIEDYRVQAIKSRLEALMISAQLDYIYLTINEIINPKDRPTQLILLEKAVEKYTSMYPVDNLDLVQAVHDLKQDIKDGKIHTGKVDLERPSELH